MTHRLAFWIVVGAIAVITALVLIRRYGASQRALGETAFRVTTHDSAVAAWAREREAFVAQAEQAHGAADQLAMLEYERRRELEAVRAGNHQLRARLEAALAQLPETSIVVVAIDSLRAEAEACGSALALCAARADSLGVAFAAIRQALHVEQAGHDSTRTLWRAAEERTARLAARRSRSGLPLVLTAGACFVGGLAAADERVGLAAGALSACAVGLMRGFF